jgi:hypothetical protein
MMRFIFLRYYVRRSRIGKKFVEAGRLKLRPLCVYDTNDIPQTAIPSHTIDRCIAKAVYTAALF